MNSEKIRNETLKTQPTSQTAERNFALQPASVVQTDYMDGK